MIYLFLPWALHSDEIEDLSCKDCLGLLCIMVPTLSLALPILPANAYCQRHPHQQCSHLEPRCHGFLSGFLLLGSIPCDLWLALPGYSWALSSKWGWYVQREFKERCWYVILLSPDSNWTLPGYPGALCHWCANEMVAKFGLCHHDTRVCGHWEDWLLWECSEQTLHLRAGSRKFRCHFKEFLAIFWAVACILVFYLLKEISSS